MGTSGLQMMGQSRAPNRKQYNIITSGFSSFQKKKTSVFLFILFSLTVGKKIVNPFLCGCGQKVTVLKEKI